jgi:hypothetical protein
MSVAVESQPVFDIESLRRVEGVYNARLAHDPGDHGARMHLAWCLFMQALHECGQQSVIAALFSPDDQLDARTIKRIRSVLDRDAKRMLRECLRHSVTVIQLSTDPREQRDAQNLQALVRLSGGDPTVQEAEGDGRRIMKSVARELINPQDWMESSS